MDNKDSISNTFAVAGTLCLVCSLLVSITAVGLRNMQQANQALDKRKNILTVAGFSAEEVKAMEPAEIDAIFEGGNESIEIRDTLVELASGKQLQGEELESVLEQIGVSLLEEFDQESIVKTPELSKEIEGPVDIGLPTREKYSHVYEVWNKKKAELVRYVFPVKGKGLWSTLMGYLAVDSKFETIEGLTFYSHKETPGLGGEVDNPKWKKQWQGRMIYTEAGELANKYVVKGTPAPDNRNAVSGLSGATITSNGVSKMVRYWLSDQGFGDFIDQASSQPSGSVLPEAGSSGDGKTAGRDSDSKLLVSQ